MPRSVRRAPLFAGAVALLLAAACQPSGGAPPAGAKPAPGAPTAASQPAPRTVKIAASRGLVSMPVWNLTQVAPRYGLNVEIVFLLTYAEQQQAVVTGQTDVGTSGVNNPAILLSNDLRNARVIAGQVWGGQNLVMRKGVDVNAWRDLEGKRIGTAPGTWARVLFFIAARQHGVDLSRINLLDITAAGTTELQALQRGELDGFVLFSPTMDRAVVDGYGYYPPNVDIGDVDFGDANGIIIANTQFLNDQETATNFMRAWVESIDQMRTDEEAFVAIGTQVTGVDAAVAREAYRHFRFGYNIDEKAIVAAARLGPEFGFANADYSGQVPDLLDYDPLMRATGKDRAALSTPVR